MPNMYGLRRDDSVIMSIDRDVTKIGRHTSNNIVINAPSVARYHSTIVRLDGKYYINDKNTANGTFVGQYQIPPNRETRLEVGDRIGFGTPAGKNSKCTFEVVYIQLDNINNELPNVVGSSSDSNLILSEIHYESKPEIGSMEPANGSAVTFVNTCTSNEKENSGQRSTESKDCFEIFMMPSRCETKIESSDSSINDLTLDDNENHESGIITIDLCQEESTIIDLCDDLEEITMVQEEVSSINCEMDVKPFKPLFVSGVQYSTLDEITILDSDEEDFLSSQSSTTCMDNDFSDSLESTFNGENLDGLETSCSSHCTDLLNWYESGQKELKIDLPIQNQVSPRKNKKRAHSESLEEQAKPHERHLSKERVKNEDSDAKCSRSKWPLMDDTVPEEQFKRRSSTSKEAKEIPKPVLNSCLPIVVVQDFIKPKQTSDSNKRTKSNEKSDDEEMFRLDLMKKKKPGPRSKTMRFMFSSKHKKSCKKQSSPVDKEQLKEKLRLITLKNESPATNTKAENTKRDVVAKYTKENRSDKMYMTNETTNSTELTSSMATIMYTDIVVAPEYEERSKEMHGFDSLYDDALDLSSQIPDDSIQYTSCQTESNSPPKRIAHTHKTEEFVQSGTEKQSHTRLNEEAAPISKGDRCQNQCAKKGKSPSLEMNFYTEKLEKVTKKKKVHFSEGKVDCQVLNIDPEERRITGHASNSKKINCKKLEQLDCAIVHACRWNVKWLKEQKEGMAPPPHIYVKEGPCLEKPDKRLLLEYREKLKNQLFLHLWRALRRSHNKPNRNYLPNTQSVIDGKRVYKLHVESVQLQNINLKSPRIRIITAYRDIDNMENGQLASGQMVILILRVKQAEQAVESKINIFAYVAYAHQVLDKDCELRQKVILKIFPRNFEIVIPEIKVKVLSNTSFLLKRFEALALVKQRSPLIDFLSSQRSEPVSLPVVNTEEQNFVDNAYLNESQKSAIITCLNCISSSEPSVCVIDGLPGTGKSRVIVSLMMEMFSETRLGQLPTDLKVFIITKSDVLADELAHRLVRRTKGLTSMNVLRYGQEIFNPKVTYCSVKDRVQELIKENKGNPLIDLDEEIRITEAKIESYKLTLESEHLTEDNRVKAKGKLNTYERLLKDLSSAGPNRTKDQLLERAAKNEVFQNANVVVTSSSACWSSNSHCFEHDFVLVDHDGRDGGNQPKFTVCIFDDANYMSEEQMLVPILLRVQNLVLVGDSRNRYYSTCGDEWPFCRLVNDFKKNGSKALISLGYQHRIHPGVDAFKWLDESYSLPYAIESRSSSLIHFLMMDLQIDNSTSLNYSVKWMKQADFCCRLLTKIYQFESEMPIAIIVVTNEEKIILEKMIPNHVRVRGDQPPIHVRTLKEVFGKDYEIVIACFPTKSFPMEPWLYLVSSRARFHLFMCGYFGDESMKNDKGLLRLKAEAVPREMCIKWKVDDDLPAEYLRTRQPPAN